MKFVQPNIFLYFFLFVLGISGFFLVLVWPQAEGFYAFIVFSGVGGFGVAKYIHHIKTSNKQLVCPVGSNCNAVISSRYAKFLGISLEYWGMAYYAFIFLAYMTLIFKEQFFSETFSFLLFGITVAAFFFSLYLLFIQAFILRQWCIWCLLSAGLSIIIFIISLSRFDFAVAILAEIEIFVGAIHALGFILGAGGATAVLFLFSKFLQDFVINDTEQHALKILSELIWLGLILTLVSQLSLFVAYTEILARSPVFIMQTASLFVVAIGGAILMIIFAPLLSMIPFSEMKKDHVHTSIEKLRKPLFVIGAITLVSWYFAFIMDYLQEHTLQFLLGMYLLMLLIGIFVALMWEKKLEVSVSE